MRRAILVSAAVALVGCSRGNPDLGHFNTTALAEGEKAIATYFQPSKKLSWGPVQKGDLTRETHVLGLPMLKSKGDLYWREAKEGSRTFRIAAEYEKGYELVRVIASVSHSGTGKWEKTEVDLKLLDVEATLAKAFIASGNHQLKHQGKEFTLTSRYANSKVSPELSCSFLINRPKQK